MTSGRECECKESEIFYKLVLIGQVWRLLPNRYSLAQVSTWLGKLRYAEFLSLRKWQTRLEQGILTELEPNSLVCTLYKNLLEFEKF